MKIYLAASSADIDRAKHWRDRLVDAGIEVTSTWITNVEKVGAANPRDATREQRAEWMRGCFREVSSSDVLWFLVPPLDKPTRGAWMEFDYALEHVQDVFASGDTLQSIACALADDEYATDEEAFAALVEMARSAA